MSKHTATLHAWLDKYSSIEGLFDSSAEAVVAALTYTRSAPDDDSYFKREGYTHIGTAEITVTLPARDEVVSNKVAALRAERQAVLVKAEAESQEIEKQIQSLLAISFDGVAV